MPLAHQYAVPSTLADLAVQVKQAFDAMGNAIPVMVGKALRERGPGGPARVLFVPEDGPGKIAPSIEMGHSVSMVHSCTVLVRAEESGEDLERFKAVYTLADLVIDCIQTAGTGRIEWGSLGDGSPADTDGYGAELAFSFTYRRDIPHNAKRWALAPAEADTTDQVPSPPPGEFAEVEAVTPTTEPVT